MAGTDSAWQCTWQCIGCSPLCACLQLLLFLPQLAAHMRAAFEPVNTAGCLQAKLDAEVAARAEQERLIIEQQRAAARAAEDQRRRCGMTDLQLGSCAALQLSAACIHL